MQPTIVPHKEAEMRYQRAIVMGAMAVAASTRTDPSSSRTARSRSTAPGTANFRASSGADTFRVRR